MAFEYYESAEYHDLLNSDQRPALISNEIYSKFIPGLENGENILDFGCGIGHVSLLYANRFENNQDSHIYACDYQEDLLDILWRRVSQRQVKNLTPFFMPMRSRQHFPKWLPSFRHIVMSLSLSNAIDPKELLQSFIPIAGRGAEIHILEWENQKNHPLLDQIVTVRRRLSMNDVVTYLNEAGFTISKEYPREKMYFAVSARMTGTRLS